MSSILDRTPAERKFLLFLALLVGWLLFVAGGILATEFLL
jgi:hypothetical protein